MGASRRHLYGVRRRTDVKIRGRTFFRLSYGPTPMSASLFAAMEMAPADPILGVTEAFHADPNPNKVNLGVGVYTDDEGKVPVLQCVRQAEQQLAEQPLPRNYLPIDGLKTYDRAVQEVVFGLES